MFPINYVDVKVPLQILAATNESIKIDTTPPPPPLALSKQPTTTSLTAKALFNFTAEAPEDLTLRVNK